MVTRPCFAFTSTLAFEAFDDPVPPMLREMSTFPFLVSNMALHSSGDVVGCQAESAFCLPLFPGVAREEVERE